MKNMDFFQEIEHREVPWGERVICVLTLAGRQLDLQETPRSRIHAFTERNGRLLPSEIIMKPD